MSKSLHDKTATQQLAATWEFDLDYLTLGRFAQLVVERELEHIAASSWATERMALEDVLDRALCTLRDWAECAAVLDLGDDLGGECLAHLSLQRGRARVYAAARSLDVLASAKAWIEERYPVSQPEERQEIQLSFWTHDRNGRRTSRTIA